MDYKLIVGKKIYYASDNKTASDRIQFPEEITKFRFWNWLFNPTTVVYRYVDERWELVFCWPYRKLLQKNIL